MCRRCDEKRGEEGTRRWVEVKEKGGQHRGKGRNRRERGGVGGGAELQSKLQPAI